MNKKFSSILIVVLTLILMTSSIVASSIGIQSPSAMLLDSKTGDILYEKNIDSKRAIASTTKIMTYLLVMEAIDEGKINMNDEVTISKVAARTEGSSYKLRAGDKVTVRELIDSMIIISANDSAVALAEHVSGGIYPFSLLMNQKAKELGLENFNFINPNGLPLGNDDQNKMTTRSLAKIVDYTLEKYGDDLINTSKKKYFVGSYKKYNKKNTNKLLQTSNIVDGLKTGYTDLAGYCLVSTYEHPQNKNHRLISIVLGSKSSNQRFEDSLRLIEHGIQNYKNNRIINQGQVLKYDALKNNGKIIPVEFIATENLDKITPKDVKVNVEDVLIARNILEEDIYMGREIKAKVKFSDGTEEQISLKVNRGVSVFINNQQLNFDDLRPIVKQGRTLLPVRSLSEQMNFDIEWDSESSSVKMSNEENTIEFRIGSRIVKKNGKEIQTDSPAEIVNNTTFVPIRFISENLNKGIEWIDGSKEIIIYDHNNIKTVEVENEVD